MKTIRNLLLGVSLLPILLIFSCNTQPQSNIDIEAEKEAIQKVVDEHLDAVDSLNVDRILAVQTDDHLDMPPNRPRIFGKEGYKEYFTPYIGFFKSLKDQATSFETDEFVVSGNWAFQIGTYYTKYLFQDGNVIEDEGNYVWIFKKESDGNWKWARVIHNSTKPL